MDYPVLVSYANDGYYDFAKNMLLNLNKKLKFHKLHFYCLDNEIYNKLTKMELGGWVSFELWNKNSVSKRFESYGSREYNLITHTKMEILRDALKKYGFIHFIDCDVVCINEPTLDHYKKYEEYDIIFQHDAGMYSATKLHAPTLHHIWTCTGNISLRNTDKTLYLLNKIEEYQVIHKQKNDQECLYQYFQDEGIKDIRNYPHAKLYTYEIDEYTNGYWLNKDIGGLGKTFFFHANHVVGKQNKMGLLIKAGEYYL